VDDSSATPRWRCTAREREIPSSRTARPPPTSTARAEGYYLDFPGNPLDPGCGYEKLGRRWNGDRKPVVYAHIATEQGRPDQLALQYWFYYIFPRA
jgi:hypothetical protein